MSASAFWFFHRNLGAITFRGGSVTTLLDFTFTAGQTQNWFSRHGSQNIGTEVSGSRDMAGSPVVLSRIWERGAATFQLQQNGAGATWTAWVANFPNATITITTPHGVVTFMSDSTKTVGGTFITWRPTTAQQVILAAVVVGDEVSVVITT